MLTSIQNFVKSFYICSTRILLQRFAAAIASGALLSACQSPTGFGLLAIVALLPWLIASKGSGPLESVLLGITSGLAFGIFGSHWLFDAFTSLGTSGIRSMVATLAISFWAKGILFGAVGWLRWKIRAAPFVYQVALPSIFFGIGESIISGSRWGLPLILFGHSQIIFPGVAQLATTLGVPGISALLFSINLSLSEGFRNRITATPLVVSLASTWTVAALFGVQIATSLRPPTQTHAKSILLVQPNIPHHQRWEPAFQRTHLNNIAVQTTRALDGLSSIPDLILWPENLLTIPLSSDKALRTDFQNHIDSFGIPVVTGLIRQSIQSDSENYRNSAVWWAPEVGLIDAIDKTHAIPLVESSQNFWGRRFLTMLVGDVAEGPMVEESLHSHPLNGDFQLLPALCFEALFPHIVAKRRTNNSVAIINLADDSWVPGEVADSQLVSAAAFRAIEQRLTLIRIAHGGLSVVIDPYGRTIESLPPNQSAHLLVRVSATPPTTRLEQFVLLAIPAVSGIVTWIGLYFRQRKRRRNALRENDCKNRRGESGSSLDTKHVIGIFSSIPKNSRPSYTYHSSLTRQSLNSALDSQPGYPRNT